MEIDIALDQFGNLVAIDRGAETVQGLGRTRRYLAAFSQQARYGGLDDTAR